MKRFHLVGLLILVALTASLFETTSASTLTYNDAAWSSILMSGPDTAKPGETITVTLYGKTATAGNTSLHIRIRCDTSTAQSVVILEDDALPYGSYPEGHVVSKTYQVGLPTNAVNRRYVYADVNTTVSYFYGFPTTLVEDPKYTDLQSNVTTLQNNVTSLQTQVSQLTTTVSNLQSTISTLQAEKTSLQSQITSLQTRITQLTTNNTNLQNRINTLETEKTGLQSQVTSLQAQVTTLTSDKAVLQSQVSTLQSEVSTLQSQVNNLLSQVHSLESQVSTGTTIQIALAIIAAVLMISTIYFARNELKKRPKTNESSTTPETQQPP